MFRAAPIKRLFSHLSRNSTLRCLSTSTETLIIGGGPIGLSTAYHLATTSPSSNITIVERDPTYAKASATLSAGGIRQQFSLEENVSMTLYGRDFLRSSADLLRVEGQDEEVDVQFQEHGYLFLASSESGAEVMKRNNEVQTGVGADVKLLNKEKLREKFPWLNVEDILIGSYGETGEGWFDPWILLRGLKRKCQSLGVNFIKGSPVNATRDTQTGRILSVDVLEQQNQKNSQTTYHVNNVINAAGAHCASLMETLAGGKLQYPIPVEGRKRCIFFFHCATDQTEIVPRIAPLTVCPISNVYFRSEGHANANGEATGNFLCGVSPTKENDHAIQDVSDLDYADHELWDEIIWPALYHRVPAFGEVKLKSSWAGLYEYNTLDQNAIIDFHPEIPNILMVNGFSGHGLQQAPAAGRAAAELLAYGKFQTLDLSIFSFDRCCGKSPPVFELGIV